MTVIVGVDSSEASKAALRLAAQEARWRQAPLVAVSAYELPLGPVGGFPGGAMHTKGEEQATAEAELRATVDHELRDDAGQAKVRVSAGLAGQVIIEAAREAQAELIVLAAHPGRSVVPGTVSQYVLLKARCPVTIGPDAAQAHRVLERGIPGDVMLIVDDDLAAAWKSDRPVRAYADPRARDRLARSLAEMPAAASAHTRASTIEQPSTARKLPTWSAATPTPMTGMARPEYAKTK